MPNKSYENEAVLVLEDGSVFHGKAIGKIGTTTGEIAFNTGMTGYQEVFTDPSYYGQILIMTNSHIGNYGALSEEAESNSIKINGLICKKFADHYSRPLASMSLNDYFTEHSLTGISDIDTRELVRHIRSKGAMNCIISSETLEVDALKKQLNGVPSMDGLELSSKVTTEKSYEMGSEQASHRVAVLDLGAKQNILRCLAERDVQLKVFPGDTPLEEMLKWNPNGFMISNGPGDPAPMDYAIETVKEIVNRDIPLFGICLGCQVLGLSQGMKTYKMHHGHRGQNHPVQNLITGKSEITSQNHGFALDGNSNMDGLEITHVNLNDKTVEGIRVKGKKAFAVQYHPEAAPGPHDSRYLFDQFIESLK